MEIYCHSPHSIQIFKLLYWSILRQQCWKGWRCKKGCRWNKKKNREYKFWSIFFIISLLEENQEK